MASDCVLDGPPHQVDALLGWNAAEQWSQLLQPTALSYFLPGVLLGVIILVLVMRVRHFLMLPTLLLAVPVGFYLIMSVMLGFSLQELRDLGLVAQAEPSADPWHVFSNFKFAQVHGIWCRGRWHADDGW